MRSGLRPARARIQVLEKKRGVDSFAGVGKFPRLEMSAAFTVLASGASVISSVLEQRTPEGLPWSLRRFVVSFLLQRNMHWNTSLDACGDDAEVLEQGLTSVDVRATANNRLELDVDSPNPQSASFVSPDMRRHLRGHVLYVDA